MDFLALAMIGGTILVGTLWGYISFQQNKQTVRLLYRLYQEQPFYLSETHDRVACQWQAMGEKDSKQWRPCILFVGHKRLAVYPRPAQEDASPLVSIAPHELRGFWRPIPYHSGENEVQIHAQIGLTWGILRLKLPQSQMYLLIRAIKELSTADQIKAYRRQRPYPQKGLSPAYPAEQRLTGEWELFNPVDLYLTPLHLLVLRQGEIQKVFNLDQIQQIGALKRMEGLQNEGVFRFHAENKVYAFATNDYEAWAESLADAAKRSLEEPVMRKQKSKDASDEWDDTDS